MIIYFGSKKHRITKALFEKLYLKQRIPVKKIRKILDIGMGTFYKYLSGYKIPKRTFTMPKEKKHWAYNTKWSKQQRIKAKKRMSGKNNHNYGKFGKESTGWKTGRKYGSGYIYVYVPSHPGHKRRYVAEHRLVMEKHLGRYLKPGEEIHHINGIKDDNRLSNLMLFSSRSEHLSYDKKQRRSIMLNLANIKQFLNKFNKRKLIKIRNIVDELLNQ
jgi:uncharacterized protein (DUF1330 family)